MSRRVDHVAVVTRGLEHDDVFAAAEGEVIRDARADHSGADDHNFGSVWHVVSRMKRTASRSV